MLGGEHLKHAVCSFLPVLCAQGHSAGYGAVSRRKGCGTE